MEQTTKHTTRGTKSPQKRNKRNLTPAPKHDYFTAVCKASLGVEVTMEHQFHPTRKWRFDYALTAYRIALEVEGGVWTGGRHTSPQGFLGDIEKYNTATLMGWRVFRTTPEDLLKKKTLDLLKEAMGSTNNVTKTAENG